MATADMQTDGIREVVRKHLTEAMGYEISDAKELDGDDLFEQVIGVTLDKLPLALGRLTGHMMKQVLTYGEHSGWDPIEDSAVFIRRFEQGMAEGLGYQTPMWTFERERVIEHFEREVEIVEKGFLPD